MPTGTITGTSPGEGPLTPSLPTNGLTIDGTTYDLAGRNAIGLRIIRANFVVRRGIPALQFYRHSMRPQAAGNPFLNKTCSLTINGRVQFSGDVTSWRQEKDGKLYKWIYEAHGLRRRGERFPVHDDQTGTDSTVWDLFSTDPSYVGSKSGRTVGQVAISVIEGITNSARLTSAGIGAFTSAGSGAAATCIIAGGAVSGSPTIAAGGSGYTTAPTVLFVGGNPTSPATGTAVVSGGVVTGITMVSHGAGYLRAPIILISRLPAWTLWDLGNMDLIPPVPLRVSGESFLNGIEAFIQEFYPNHFLHVDHATGMLRFWDHTKAGGTSATITGDGLGALALPTIDPVTGALIRVDLISGGSGYTTASLAITGSGGSGASTGSPVITGGRITSVSGSGGSGYPEGRSLLLTHGYCTVEPPSVLRDTSNCFTRCQIVGRPLIQGVELLESKADISKAFDHDGLSSSSGLAKWKLADYNQPTGNTGQATANAVLATSGIDTVFPTGVGSGSGYVTAPTISFTGGGGSGATATCTVASGKIATITRTAAGANYTSAPNMVFNNTGTGGTSAAATCQLPPRAVDHFTLIDGGYNYGVTAPAVAVTGGGGTLATGTAHLTGGIVTSVTLGTSTSDFTSAPNVTIGGPTGPNTDYGTCTCPTTLTVTVTSLDPTRNWPANFWDQSDSGRQGILLLRSSVSGSSIDQFFSVPVVSNTSLSPGGTSTLTLASPIPILTYDAYSLRGITGGRMVVWQRYKVNNPAIAASMAPPNEPFYVGYPVHGSDGSALTMTVSNTAQILYSPTGNPPYQSSPWPFTVDPVGGYITFTKPVVMANNSDLTNLGIGGSSVLGQPNDIDVIVGCYKGSLTATWPADISGVPQYQGTANTIDGMSETYYLPCNDWIDPGQNAQMLKYAQEFLKAYQDAVLEAEVDFLDYIPGDCCYPLAISMTGYNGAAFTTGWENLEIPVDSTNHEWHPEGGPLGLTTQLGLSNRVAAVTASRFLTPPQTSQALGFESSGGGVFGALAIFNEGHTVGGYVPYGNAQAAQDAFGGGAGTQAALDAGMFSPQSQMAGQFATGFEAADQGPGGGMADADMSFGGMGPNGGRRRAPARKRPSEPPGWGTLDGTNGDYPRAQDVSPAQQSAWSKAERFGLDQNARQAGDLFRTMPTEAQERDKAASDQSMIDQGRATVDAQEAARQAPNRAAIDRGRAFGGAIGQRQAAGRQAAINQGRAHDQQQKDRLAGKPQGDSPAAPAQLQDAPARLVDRQAMSDFDEARAPLAADQDRPFQPFDGAQAQEPARPAMQAQPVAPPRATRAPVRAKPAPPPSDWFKRAGNDESLAGGGDTAAFGPQGGLAATGGAFDPDESLAGGGDTSPMRGP